MSSFVYTRGQRRVFPLTECLWALVALNVVISQNARF